MLRDFPFGELKQLYHLYVAWCHKRKARFARARHRLNLAIASTPEPSAFILAFDGLLMVGEDRLWLAQVRFEESLNLARQVDGADDDYVAKYCQLWLAIYDEGLGWEEIRDAAEAKSAAWPMASRMIQIFLPRSCLNRLEEICGHRTAKRGYGAIQTSTPAKINTSIAFAR